MVSARTSRVRVFLGDPTLTEPRVEAAVAELVTPSAGDVDLEVVRLPEDSVDRVEEGLRQVGMFSRGRCVVLRGSLDEAEDLEKLMRFLEKGVPAESALIIASPKLDGRSRFYRWLSEHALIEDLRFERKFESRGLSVEEAGDFIRQRVVAAGLKPPDERVINAIAERAGSDLGELGNEIDRLCLTVRPGTALTHGDVAREMRDMASAWIFAFTDALFERRAGEAMQVVEQLLAQGDVPLRMVAAIAGRVAEMLAAARYARSEGLGPIPTQSGAFVKSVYPRLSSAAKRRFNRPFAAYHAFRVGQGRGVDALRRLHAQLLELDLALKSSGGEPRHLFASFVDVACARGA